MDYAERIDRSWAGRPAPAKIPGYLPRLLHDFAACPDEAAGIRRYAVLEAVDHPDPGTYIVAADFGDRAQWLRSVRASPRVRVYTGARRPATATARPRTPQETAAALTAYARRDPRAWAVLRPVFETTLGARIDNDGTSLPLIALDLADSRQARRA